MNFVTANELKNISDEYDLIVVGCGFCGSVIARLAAEECGSRVLVLERRNHIAGNMYDEMDADGFLIQKYGPHVFHTSEDWIYNFICRFAQWYPYQAFYGVEIDGRFIPAPFGFKAIRLLYPGDAGEKLIAKLKEAYPNRSSVPVLDLMESLDEDISGLAKLLYEKDYKPYAAKQWNLDPKELDRSVLARLPIIFSERENYFDPKEVKYECMPCEGYTKFFESLLSHDSISVALNVDALQLIKFDIDQGKAFCNQQEIGIPILFTGALEDFFEGNNPLPYRSLFFEYKTFEEKSFQPTAIMTYPQTHKFLRSTEYSKMMQNPPVNKTVVAFEYPVPYDKKAQRGNEPYYPVLTAENIERNAEYSKKLSAIRNLFFCGRLADYKYYDMDKAIARAFEKFRELKEILH